MTHGRKPGAQPGNRNALKHGAYAELLRKPMQKVLRRMRELSPKDLSEEIALMRTRLAEVCEADPENIEVFVMVARALVRMVAVHYGMTKEQQEEIHESLRDLIHDLAPPTAKEPA